MSLYNCGIDYHLQSDDPVFSPRDQVFIPNPIQPDNPEPNLNPSSRTQEDFPNDDTISSMNEKWVIDLSQLCPESNRCPPSKAPTQKRLQNPKLKCSVCGKLFCTASSLKKHSVSHSEQRNHVCSICKRAFKRQDHLKGHLATHLKTKPFTCTEKGCNKSYFLSGSLKKHLVLQHGLCTGLNTSARYATCKELQKKEQPGSFPVLPPISKEETFTSQPSFLLMDLIQYKSTDNSQEPVSDGDTQDTSESLTAPSHNNHTLPEYTYVPLDTYTLLNLTSNVTEHPESFSNQVLDVDYLGLWCDEVLESINPKQSMFVYPSDESLTCLFQNSLNGQPLEVEPVEMYVASVSTSESTCLPETITRPQEDIKCTNGEEKDLFLKAYAPASGTRAAEQAIWSENCVTGHRPSVSSTSIGKQKEQQLAECCLSNVSTCSSLLTSSNSSSDQKHGSHYQNPYVSKKRSVPVGSTVSLSQSAVEASSFSPKLPDEKRNSGIGNFKRMQAKKTYELPSEEEGGTDIADSRLANTFGKMELADSDIFLPRGSAVKRNPSVHGEERIKGQPVQALHMGDRKQLFQEASSTTVMKDPGPLVMPVSVPVTLKDHPADNKVNEAEGQLQNLNPRKRKRPVHKPLYIPPPLPDVKASPMGSFQSNSHSPNTCLWEQFQKGIFTYPTYTPPPMLSPIRPGGSLYFNSVCSSSPGTGPNFNYTAKETSPSPGILAVKDSLVFTIPPQINIGNRFQAEIPEIQDPSSLGGDKADLVWKPLKMAKTVTKFLNLACSSAVPGGGCNLEFALHCLHLSRGNILEALDKLLIQEPQKNLPQYLADYHYAGSDHWSAAEKQLFKKAYRSNRKDFSYIQAMIPEKNIYQCVEYYYTWKKRVSLDKRQISAAEKEAESDRRKFDCNKNDAISGDKTTIRKPDGTETPPPIIQEENRDKIIPVGQFPCRECDRVFEKIKSRNAHMRKHCQKEMSAHSLTICEEESSAY